MYISYIFNLFLLILLRLYNFFLSNLVFSKTFEWEQLLLSISDSDSDSNKSIYSLF